MPRWVTALPLPSSSPGRNITLALLALRTLRRTMPAKFCPRSYTQRPSLLLNRRCAGSTSRTATALPACDTSLMGCSTSTALAQRLSSNAASEHQPGCSRVAS